MSFFGPFYGDYRVAETDYTGYAYVYSCSPKGSSKSSVNVWLLARNPTVDGSRDSAF